MKHLTHQWDNGTLNLIPLVVAQLWIAPHNSSGMQVPAPTRMRWASTCCRTYFRRDVDCATFGNSHSDAGWLAANRWKLLILVR